MARPVIFCCVIAAVFTLPIVAQDSRFPDLSGFTESPTEHEIIALGAPLVAHSIQGTITFKNHPGEPLPDVLIEVIGPGSGKQIRHTTSEENGKFRIGHTPQGTYRFKTTRAGFGSVVGTIVVSRGAERAARIEIAVPIGN